MWTKPAVSARRPASAAQAVVMASTLVLGGVTLDLSPGRYELVCDLAGHDADAVYTELTVHDR